MKSFKDFISESPANCSAGSGVRGFGDVSGQPAGNISNYAIANNAESISDLDQQNHILAAHNSLHKISKIPSIKPLHKKSGN